MQRTGLTLRIRRQGRGWIHGHHEPKEKPVTIGERVRVGLSLTFEAFFIVFTPAKSFQR